MQQSLDIDAELFTTRERGLRKLLRSYWMLDSKIARLTMKANGDGLVIQPSITAAPPVEDDAWVLAEMYMSPLSDSQASIVDTVSQYLDGNGIQYLSRTKVLKLLRNTVGRDAEDEEILQMFYTMLAESLIDEERVELTDTERTAIRREREINHARQQLRTLREQKQYMDDALRKLKFFRPYYHDLLWHRYVLDKPVVEVCKAVGLLESQDKTYKDHIRQAMEAFSCLVPDKIVRDA